MKDGSKIALYCLQPRNEQAVFLARLACLGSVLQWSPLLLNGLNLTYGWWMFIMYYSIVICVHTYLLQFVPFFACKTGMIWGILCIPLFWAHLTWALNISEDSQDWWHRCMGFVDARSWRNSTGSGLGIGFTGWDVWKKPLRIGGKTEKGNGFQRIPISPCCGCKWVALDVPLTMFLCAYIPPSQLSLGQRWRGT